jgi:hypothetical protein
VSTKKSAARVISAKPAHPAGVGRLKPKHSTETAAAAKRKAPARGHASRENSTEDKEAVKEETRVMDTRSSKDRRHEDRRETAIPVEVERRTGERRAKVNRRRQIDPTTCERDYTPEEIEFMGALDDYKRRSGRMFPTCSEVLEVIKGLGYEKRAAGLAVTPAAETAPVADVATEQAV